MDLFTPAQIEDLKRHWTDRYVLVNADRPELARFKDIVGRVVTVNWNGKAVIDFQDGGWYDITASADNLTILDDAEGKAKFDAKVNSAQPYPEKQGA
jgi:PHP family Zn ribbon phosphoesterase